MNQALERAGRPERVDCRSYQEQGTDTISGIHLGSHASKDKASERYRINEEIKKKDKVDGITLKIEELKEKNISLSKTIDEKNEVIAQREKRIKELDDFIAQIINSKGWKFLENMRAIKGKISCRNIKNKKSE